MEKIRYSIREKFTDRPGPRFIKEGVFSGELFRNTVLLDLLERAVKENVQIEIDLDYTYGYNPSFLEEAFGGLTRLKGKSTVKQYFTFISREEPFLIDMINGYIKGSKIKA